MGFIFSMSELGEICRLFIRDSYFEYTQETLVDVEGQWSRFAPQHHLHCSFLKGVGQ